MTDWNLSHELIKTLLSIASSSVGGVVILALTWLVGQKLSFKWNDRQKRREIQLSALQQFYAAYGEFFAVWKLWNRLDKSAEHAEERRWELHKRAAAAEAIIEGILVKLSSEVLLSAAQLNTLGRFRRAFQLLRESIRKDVLLPWLNSDSPEYIAFKSLAVQVAKLIAGNWPTDPVPTNESVAQLIAITSNRWESEWTS